MTRRNKNILFIKMHYICNLPKLRFDFSQLAAERKKEKKNRTNIFP